jgi:GT2 family glycosyltransferase
MSAPTPGFSVIVPACARPAQLAECLARLAPGSQSLQPENYEVIVTDDSPDHSVHNLVAAHFPWARWTQGPKLGPAANRNHGARQAAREWLAFTDDDCLPEADWLKAFTQELARPDAPAPSVLEGRTYADRPKRSLSERAPVNTRGGYLWSCNLAIRAEVFWRLGGFDTGFPFASMEDVDFARRLRAAGARECFVPAAGVCHPWRNLGGFRGMWTAEERHLASVQYFLLHHPDAWPEHSPVAYLKMNARQLLHETLPGLWRWRGRGIGAALAWHLHVLKNILVLCRQPPKPSASAISMQ